MQTIETRLREAESRARTAENVVAAAAVLREAGIPGSSPEASRLFPQLVHLRDVESMRAHVQGRRIREAEYTPQARKLLAREGKARPDGSYPIDNAQDVEDAVDDFNRSNGTAEDKAHIIDRAKAVGAADKLPEGWSGSTKQLQESERRIVQLGGIPTLQGDPLIPTRLREATASNPLEALGIPTVGEPARDVDDLLDRLGIPTVGGASLKPVALRESATPERPAPAVGGDGIPMLRTAPGEAGLRHIRFTESVGGSIIRRISPKP